MLLLLACAHAPRPTSGSDAVPETPETPEAPVVPVGAATDPAVPAPVPTLDEAGLGALLTNPDSAPLVVNFWATWCGPCVAELGALHAVAAAHPTVRFLLVNVDTPEAHASVSQFVVDHDVALPVVHLAVPDASATLRRRVQGWPDSIPYTLVLEPGGRVRARVDGLVEPEELAAVLD